MAKVSSTRENMLTAASSLFRARGYEGIGIAELLEKSGAPRGSLYFHFPGGKEQIGAEVINDFATRTAARFRELDESGVDIETFIVSVFKTTAKESKACDFDGSCPIAAIAAGFGVIWALSWRLQDRAVTAVEERDGVTFYVTSTAAVGPVRLVRTPGLRRDLPPKVHSA